MDLPEGIEQVNLQAGKVTIRAAARLISDNLALSTNGLDLPFQPAPDIGAMPFHIPFAIDPEALVTAALRAGAGNDADTTPPEAYCAPTLNTLTDWALDNGQTLQLHIYRSTPMVELKLGWQAVVAAHDTPLEFRACIAVHRADANLNLEATPVQGGTARRTPIAFDAAKLGGREAAGYQMVIVALPPAKYDLNLSLSVTYKGYRETSEDNDAYLFVANPEVVSPGGAASPIAGLHITGRGVQGAAWYHVHIPQPVIAGHGPLTLVSGARQITLFQPRDIDIKITEDRGHTLSMTASQPDRYSFFLNGEAAFAAPIGTEVTRIRVPTDYMTGETWHLTVRDGSGTQTFLETWLLLPRILTPQDVMQRESKPPYPVSLSAQANHRYGALKAQIAGGASAADLAQVARALDTLEAGYEKVRLEPLKFPKVVTPDVSVVIPAHNKVEVTYSALCALLLADNKVSFEVVVVDDASTDQTRELEKIVSGITVIHNAEPQRFIRACNAGVEKARGTYVVLLNNDTEPTAGWLDALVDAFTRFPKVGLAGSKLLYPDGRLQDAGGIIWGSGNPWNYGNKQNPWDPRYSYARQADYLSGAALMTTAKIWDEVGGLSAYLEPMYFEDTDLAFKVRAAGYSTWFVPSSVVYHYEGATSGTDVSTGFKKYQEINRPKFKRRWAHATADFGLEGQNPDLEKDRGIVGRVLFIDYTTPRLDTDAGSYAAIQEIKLVQSLGYKVTFLPQNIAHLGRYTEDLERQGVEMITAPFCMSAQDFLAQRGAEFDAIYITRYYVGQAVIDTIRRVAPKAKIIFNNADLHFLRQLRAGVMHNDPARIAEAQKVRETELAILRKVDVALSYNEVEHAVIQSHTDGAVKVLTCPWVVDIPASVPAIQGRAGLSFLGSFRHHPNLEGMTWFAEAVMPRLASSHPDIMLSIYGSGMSDVVRALKADNIDPVGFVADIADAYDRHRVFVAPLLSGAGIKGKVLAALAHGVPTVISPVAAEGIGLRHSHDCMIAKTPVEWVSAIVALYGDAALWQSVSDNARAYVTDQFSFDRGRERMRAAFEAVDLFRSRD